MSVSIINSKFFFLRSILGWVAAFLAGLIGFLATRALNLTLLPSALTTVGFFGFAGGFLHARLLRFTGGKLNSLQYLILSLTWALCSMGGALPLFFTIGTRLEMAVRAFYCFSIFGAFGGMITAVVTRTVFKTQPEIKLSATVLVWSISFSLAAVTSDATGEWLQLLLPRPFAWLLAIAVLTIVLGCGSGYAIIQLATAKTVGRQTLTSIETADFPLSIKQDRFSIPFLFLLCTPFYLNDFANMYIKDWRLWLLIDYACVKLFPLVLMIYLIYSNKMKLIDFIGSASLSTVSFITVYLIAVLSVLFIDHNTYLISDKFSGFPSFGAMPEITNPSWKWLDLTVGLLLVGIVEECIFRGYLFNFIRIYTRRPSLIVSISAGAFGLIHWSGGLEQIIAASASGAVFMLLFLRTHSLLPVILAHFTINFIVLSRVIPPSLFHFFYAPPAG